MKEGEEGEMIDEDGNSQEAGLDCRHHGHQARRPHLQSHHHIRRLVHIHILTNHQPSLLLTLPVTPQGAIRRGEIQTTTVAKHRPRSGQESIRTRICGRNSPESQRPNARSSAQDFMTSSTTSSSPSFRMQSQGRRRMRNGVTSRQRSER